SECINMNFGFPINACKPDTIIYNQNVNGIPRTDTITFKYDGQNRLSEVFNLVNLGSTRYLKYTYFADSVQEDSYRSFPATASNFVGRLTFYTDGNCQVNKIKDQRANYSPI